MDPTQFETGGGVRVTRTATPFDPAVLAELADALQENGQPAEALAALDRAAAGGETADVAAGRSRLFAALALWEAAVAAAERAVALDPRNYTALAALGWPGRV